jgi:signal peptidase I
LSFGRFLRDLCIVLVCAGCVVWGATRWLVIPWVVVGPSMEPTLQEGDCVFVDLWTLRRRLARPGDIVVVTGPSGEELVKRIGREPYPGNDPYPPSTLETESPLEPTFVLLGDNPDHSLDSRAFGRVPKHRIRGRVAWRYWPLSRCGSIE